MQNFKYKVWSQQHKKMFNVIGLMFIYKNNMIRVKTENYTPQHVADHKEFDVPSENIHPFTGYLDKNNKEIYEGDILEFDDSKEDDSIDKEPFEFKNRASVVFKNGRWGLDNFLIEDGDIEDDIYNHYELMGVWQHTTIIGNIHENAELLHEQ